MKLTIEYKKGTEKSYQIIEEKDFAKAKARLERLGYEVKKVNKS